VNQLVAGRVPGHHGDCGTPHPEGASEDFLDSAVRLPFGRGRRHRHLQPPGQMPDDSRPRCLRLSTNGNPHSSLECGQVHHRRVVLLPREEEDQCGDEEQCADQGGDEELVAALARVAVRGLQLLGQGADLGDVA